MNIDKPLYNICKDTTNINNVNNITRSPPINIPNKTLKKNYTITYTNNNNNNINNNTNNNNNTISKNII